MEELVISNIIRIAATTTHQLTGKHIRLQKDCHIICHGTLVLQDCVIYSREKGYTGRIYGKEKCQIKMVNCTFVNFKDSENNYFIELEEGSDAHLKGCVFDSCTRYIKFAGKLVMENCEFVNCLFHAVATRWNAANADCCIENITIKNDAITPGAKGAMNNVYDHERRVFHLETKKCLVSNVRISEGPEFSQKILKHREKHYSDDSYFFTCGIIENVTMENTTMSLWSMKLIQNCKFVQCIAPVRTQAEMFRGHPMVKNCVFLNCTNVINADHRSKIEECTFSNCYGNLIEQKQFSEDGKISVDKCKFLNCSDNTKEYGHSFKYIVRPGNALLFFRGSKKSGTSSVKNCLIEGMVLNEGYFVATETLDRTPEHIVRVSNCEFLNCYTNRNDYEIFKLSVHRYGRLGKDINDPAIRVWNCSGLNEIRNDFIDDFGEIDFDEDDTDDRDMCD